MAHTSVEQISESLHALHERYAEDVHAIIDEIFERKIKPYLQKYGLKLYAGNGTWILMDDTWELDHYEPRWIRSPHATHRYQQKPSMND